MSTAACSRLCKATPRVAGADLLVKRYLAAFAALGEEAVAAPSRAAARGLLILARQTGLLK